ncbi:MAG: serine dehydrogenasease [Eubacterium sp.]|nr:serine dehydrogenasease [Eubacterium sp.]
MVNSIDETARNLITKKLQDLEDYLNADVIVYYGEIFDSAEAQMKKVVEDLQSEANSKTTCYIMLTTPGGSLNPVNRMVTIFRHFYTEVYFIVPDFAYSAGTIFCMSGDDIYMNYYSALGPVDPQVQNRDGKLVAALGYLDKINDLLAKAQNNTISQAEFLILKDFDLAELRAYEQAKELAVDLIQKWLVKYKFKNWMVHSNGTNVSLEEKKQRAYDIANKLSNNNIWKSHGRAINLEELREMNLKITDYGEDEELSCKIDGYYAVMQDYVAKYHLGVFVHTRRFL